MQQKLLLGHVKGDQGPTGSPGKDGVDAKIASAKGTVAPGHLDEPTVTVDVGGEPGNQTMTFAFAGLQGPQGEAGAPGATGSAGPAGRDADIVAVNVTVEPGHSEVPEGRASVSGDPGAKTIDITLTGIQGATGAAGPAGPAGPAGENATTTATATQDSNGLMSSDDKKKLDAITSGAATSVVLANGTTTTIAALLQSNVETIRAALGVATTGRNGLMPQLPSNPNA